jgi:tetratricopeptide (TPR) repeat protein
MKGGPMLSARVTSCLEDNETLDYIAGALDERDRARVEAHVDACPECRGLLADLARELAGASQRRRAAELATTAGTSDHVPEDIAPAAAPPAALGRYLVLQRLGAGGMGVVYRAYDPDLRREVAVKLLHPAHQGPDEQARLLREARAMARLAHPNTVAVFDVGKAAGAVFVAMELVVGVTLRAWLGERPRGWRAIVEVFLQAGAGLAAAHRGGLVHRDFKPENVLVGADGRVRVTDFGLAQPGADPRADAPRPSPALQQLDSVRTVPGALLGTPLYMAPEQFLGGAADERSDQFAFCVALYEGLYGAPPFPRDSLAALREAVLRGALRPPPPHAAVPRAVFDAVARGLARDPADRHPTMAALLARLTSALHRRQRVALALAGLLIGGLGVAGALLFREPPDGPCEDATARLAAVWNPERAAATRAAFRATGKSYADDTFQRVDAALVRHGEQWSAEYAAACQPRDEAGLARLACLERLRHTAASLTDMFVQTADSPIESAVLAVRSLPAPASCRGRAPHGWRAPDDGALARLQADVVLAAALRGSGRYDDALRVAQAAADAAHAHDLRPVAAAALLEVGQAAERLVDTTAARRAYRRALHVAEATGQDEFAARAWIALVGLYATPPVQLDAAEQDAGHAEALIERIGGDNELRAALAQNLATVSWAALRTEDAERHARRAVALSEEVFGADHWRTADALNALGKVALHRPDRAAAVAIYERVLAIRERELGPAHPQVALAATNLAQALVAARRCAEARELGERALATARAALAEDHLAHAAIELNLASALWCEGKLEESALHLQQAERGATRRPALRADILLFFAGLTAQLGRLDESEAHARRAIGLAQRDPMGLGLIESAHEHLAGLRRRRDDAAAHPAKLPAGR